MTRDIKKKCTDSYIYTILMKNFFISYLNIVLFSGERTAWRGGTIPFSNYSTIYLRNCRAKNSLESS